MLLRDLLIFIVILTAVALLPSAVLHGPSGLRPRPGVVPMLVAGSILILFVLALSGRSLEFGIDTAGYAELFQAHCRGQPLAGEQFSYILSIRLLNAGMLGACQLDLLPAVWGLLVIVPLLLMREPIELRLSFAAILIFSLVGVELTTNALRQGVSVSIFMLAVSLGRRRSLLALPFLALSALLHTSTFLILLVLILSMMSWGRFLFAAVGALLVVTFYLQSGIDIQSSLLFPFLYEIQKYLGHEADELWVRILGFAGVVATLACPWLLTHDTRDLRSSSYYQVSLKLGAACVPFLGLPYFGYRIIYGIYPLVVYFTLLYGRERNITLGRQFGLLLASNAVLLFVWAHGSTAMREVLFLD